MTLASSIINSAYRETNIIPLGATASTNQSTETLPRLNSLLLSVVGNEVGDSLNDINIGGDYDQSNWCSPYVPDDARLILNLDSVESFLLDPHPYEGQRLSFKDVGGNLATYNVTLDGNGRTIEGSATLTLNINSDARQWLYRADTANWVKITSLALSDSMPFPEEFDDFFITMLAMRINPAYGQTLSQATIEVLKRTRSQLRARYHNYRQVRPDLDTTNFLSDQRSSTSFSYDNDFITGRPFSWR